MKISRELKTAIIVLGGILLFVLGFTYLKSSSLFENGRTYYAIYKNVGGLTTGTPITINGHPVGKIKNIRFFDNRGNLLVTLTVDSEFKFSENSQAEIYDTGIIGGKSIQILPAFDDAPFAKTGDTLPSSVKPGLTELVTQKLTPLQEKIEGVMVSADSVLTGVSMVLDDDSRRNLKMSIENLNATVANFKNSSKALNGLLEDNKEKLDQSIGNVSNITENLSKLSDTLANANLGKTMESLQSTIASFDKILSEIEQGNGSMGKLLKDKELYNNLSDASGQLELLLQDMRLNPKRYVHFSLFGKKPKPYEPAEENTNNE